jgi:hypothetical protein
MHKFLYAVTQFDGIRKDGIWVNVWCDGNEIAQIDTTHEGARKALDELYGVCIAMQADFRLEFPAA